ncbi:RNA degradosome polyphosphate kinase [Ornithinimicrobium ciconiae]|uniref:Polyphosphate kinase n=1 Tax=Ornithinimicrobium ciconiae TaxID=2594265 RepID=A0A516G7X5_9MICO|nr:RNA degradosome polyphosphate kinase [Ornithinimicrobium ciconiae]QDO87627.1 RNA degradosome polyphosphate kinase [Ornithinimicrobium ciconiae]
MTANPRAVPDIVESSSVVPLPTIRPQRARAANGRFVSASASAWGQSDDHAEEPLPADRFLDREVSWLQFNERVLQLAADPHVPLLERTRFLAIFASNLDEFFMVRVAGLKRRIATGIATRSASGLEPREVLEEISVGAHELMEQHARLYREIIGPALGGEGITLARWDELTEEEQSRLGDMFRSTVYPVLTPLAVDPAHPFPYISGLSLNLAVILNNPQTGREHFARVKVPPLLPRFIELPGVDDLYTTRYVLLEELIAAHLRFLFPGMEVHETYTFRVTRNEDLEVEEDDAENLLTALEKELTRRRFGPPVRLEVERDMDDHVLDLLTRELRVHHSEVYRLPTPLDLTALNTIADLDRTELSYPNFLPSTHPELAPVERSAPSDILRAMRAGDVLLHHPYDSFSTSVQAFIEQAAADPHVLAIKQTLYRTSGDSPIIDALIDAAAAGKQVLAVVEIKARFDEENNISWARKLEHAGVHVVYGMVGLKTHAKLCLVVRQEEGVLRRYCHVGTGNYNPKTARLYEDLGLLTCDDAIGEDLTRLFNQLSGMAPKSKFKRLLVAPRSVRSGLVERIDAEAARGKDGSVRIKVNSIVDEAVVDALYRASMAGARVDVWVRGICALRPGVPGLSETMRVRSVLGRFLEHSRVFAFGTGKTASVYIGSADMMHRNLDRRVEAMVPITDRDQVKHLLTIFDRVMTDEVASWHLGEDGQWHRHHLDADGIPLADIQFELIDSYSRRRRPGRRR